MSNAVVKLPEKRPNADGDNMPEQTPEKRLKSATKLQNVGKGIKYCMICGCNTDHSHRQCSKREKAMGVACSVCYEPCEIKEHQEKFKLILKFCDRCGETGDHWNKHCPSPIYDDDLYF